MAIYSHVRTSDVVLLDGGTARSILSYRAFSSVILRIWNI